MKTAERRLGISTGVIVADKTEAARKLEQFQLQSPVSIRITRSNVATLKPFQDAHPGIDFWYLRFDDQMAPEVPKVVATADLVRVVYEATVAHPELVVIAQERIEAWLRSGVMAVLPDGTVFVEHVAGELRALLRLGASPSARTLLDSTGQVIETRTSRQEFWCSWDGVIYNRNDVPLAGRPLPYSVRRQLASSARWIREGAILEWVEDPFGKVVFLDYRPAPQGFLIGRDALLEAFRSGIYWTLDSTIPEPSTRLDRPLYEYVTSVLPRTRGIIFRSGGILSHLSVYAAELGIPCVLACPRGSYVGRSVIPVR